MQVLLRNKLVISAPCRVHVQHIKVVSKWQTIVHRAGKTESSVDHTWTLWVCYCIV